MNITRIKATGIELTDAIRDAVEKDLSLLDPLVARWGEAVKVDVEVGRTSQHHHKGDVFRAEINLEIHGKMLRAEEEQEDLYAAIKEAVHKIQRDLVKEKDLRG